MNYKFDNGEIVQFNHPEYGKGTGTVLGRHLDNDGNEGWVIYPKIPRHTSLYPYSCMVIETKYLVSTPF